MAKEKIRDDKGSLRMAISVKDNVILIDFAEKCAWIGLDKNSAENFVSALKEKIKLLH